MKRFALPQELATRRFQIDLVGVGGTGSELAVQLASLQMTLQALGHPGFDVRVFDGDTVAQANLSRQKFASADVGLNKAVSIVHRINIFHALDWIAVPRHYDPEHHTGKGLVITCVDMAQFRLDLAERHQEAWTSALWLDMGNGATTGQVVLGHLGVPASDGLRLPNVVDLFGRELADAVPDDTQTPSCSAAEAIQRQSWPVNRFAASLATELLWSLLRNGGLDHHGYFFGLNPVQVQPIAIDPATWSFMGYDASTD